MSRREIGLRIAITTVSLMTCVPGTASANHTQSAIFQDDNHLVYGSTAVVSRAVSTLASLGVQRLRISAVWAAIAPDATSRTRPAHFTAGNPADYPAALWMPYDRIAELAARHRMSVNFTVTAPGPLWAMGRQPPEARLANHWVPNAGEFGQFVEALGKRYSGSYPGPHGTIPRVDDWSVWNEPGQPGWLAPQWSPSGGTEVPVAAALYRRYVSTAYAALTAAGHTPRTDTILIGELSPEGSPSARGYSTAMKPMTFLRALYCVDSSYRRLRGQAASRLGCPTSGRASAFVAANPGLFHATGFAHHPYYFDFPPSE